MEFENSEMTKTSLNKTLTVEDVLLKLGKDITLVVMLIRETS